MGIILWIVFGGLVGWVASIVMATGGGIIWDVGVGIVGALIGGFIMSAFGGAGVVGFDLYSFVVALLGACVLIWVVRVARR
jgi:uncharacterized membrane protein YeaQ/YmgE (transglycosylase-associated protein family)